MVGCDTFHEFLTTTRTHESLAELGSSRAHTDRCRRILSDTINKIAEMKLDLIETFSVGCAIECDKAGYRRNI